MAKSQSVNKQLSVWTAGESLWLWRRARELTQKQAARELKMGVTLYQLLETDQKPTSLAVRVPAPLIGDLAALARRRLGWGLRKAARKAGVSHSTLLRWEFEHNPAVQTFYASMGFKFS